MTKVIILISIIN